MAAQIFTGFKSMCGPEMQPDTCTYYVGTKMKPIFTNHHYTKFCHKTTWYKATKLYLRSESFHTKEYLPFLANNKQTKKTWRDLWLAMLCTILTLQKMWNISIGNMVATTSFVVCHHHPSKNRHWNNGTRGDERGKPATTTYNILFCHQALYIFEISYFNGAKVYSLTRFVTGDN